MTRKPLRPLARIISARTAGENPDLIEQANRRARIEMQHERILRKTQLRLFMMGGIFVISFGVIGMRMTALAVSEPIEPKARAIRSRRIRVKSSIPRAPPGNWRTYFLIPMPKKWRRVWRDRKVFCGLNPP